MYLHLTERREGRGANVEQYVKAVTQTPAYPSTFYIDRERVSAARGLPVPGCKRPANVRGKIVGDQRAPSVGGRSIGHACDRRWVGRKGAGRGIV